MPPWWHNHLLIARWMGISPVELDQMPISWRDAALAVMSAEHDAAQAKQRK